MVVQGSVPKLTRSESTAFINEFMTLRSRSKTADQSYTLRLLVSLATRFIAFQRKLVGGLEDSKGPGSRTTREGNLLIINGGIRSTADWKLGRLEKHCER